MKPLFALLCALICAQALPGQSNSSGIVQYNRVSHWNKIAQGLSYLSTEEKDRIQLTWGKSEGYTSKMKLIFTDKESLYTYAEEQGSTEDGEWTWRQDEFIIHRDFEASQRKDLIEMLGRTYVVEGEFTPSKWKVLNEIKEVAGYLCMKAETRDTIKNQSIEAWFTDAIPVSAGPELINGLPGLILELSINQGAVVITATRVDLKDSSKEVKPPAKMKGRKIDSATYDKLLSDHIKTSIEGRKNPFWSLRF